MIDEPGDRPDITLTLDRDGVIRDVAPSPALRKRGARPLARPPLGRNAAAGTRRARRQGDLGEAEKRRAAAFPDPAAPAERARAAGRIHHRQPRQERRLRRHRPQPRKRLRPANPAGRRAEGARAGFLAAARDRAALSRRARRHRRSDGAGARLEPAHRRDQRAGDARLGAAARRGILPRPLRARPQGAGRRAGARPQPGARADHRAAPAERLAMEPARLAADQRFRRLLPVADVGARRGGGDAVRSPTASNRFGAGCPTPSCSSTATARSSRPIRPSSISRRSASRPPRSARTSGAGCRIPARISR